ncbi:hypothetical protein SAMN05216241_10949 [Limimonas halophila]|uniref:KANL3/Tex30 alpha/beta hydrolase-like domain-containing protein n=1 Tax=Limimonas halophila TaxID=1082479 RepID=A0A1G7TF45_9PROT|nr:alpha/beta family hydrolase [Limimonas halophila]SDG33654.1 hypothetical protein SAMN05216241_10949 [Limimonas halophila]
MTETPDLIVDGPTDAPVTVALAHGAGVGHDSPFMTAMAQGVAADGVRVARFEFPYMARMRREGGRRPPDKEATLLATFRAVLDALGPRERVVLAGKSMGGRMATRLAADLEGEGAPVAGAAALGYPFHPPGKPANLRIEHLQAIATPVLIVQGERDAFGTPGEVAGYSLAESVRLRWERDGDHHFVPRKSAAATQQANWADAAAALAAFAHEVAA